MLREWQKSHALLIRLILRGREISWLMLPPGVVPPLAALGSLLERPEAGDCFMFVTTGGLLLFSRFNVALSPGTTGKRGLGQ